MEEKLDMQSPDWVNKNSQFIAERFPNCVTETAEGIKVDFELLKQELSNDIIEGNKERYRLEWPGKREAIVTANLPTTKTLRPVREDSVDFDNTENLYIEGDNLEVLKILQESYLGKVKMIYIDPPYNTGKDFVYKDNFSKATQEELIESGQKDEYNQRLVANPESSGRYHSDWLTMMYPRLKLARNLLKEDGVIFASIDHHETHNLRKIFDEVFGEQNYISTFCWQKGKEGGNDSSVMRSHYENILFYAKNITSPNLINLDEKDTSRHKLELTEENLVKGVVEIINKGELFQLINLSKQKDYTIEIPLIDGTFLKCSSYSPQTSIDKWIKVGKVFVGNKKVAYIKSFLKDELKGQKPSNILTQNDGTTKSGSIEIRNYFGDREIFSYPKSSKLIKRLLEIGGLNNEIHLDFFSGSSSTADAIMQLNNKDNGNRKFIMVQLPEEIDKKSKAFKAGYKNLCEIGKERIRRAGKKILEESKPKAGELEFDSKDENKLDVGFRVYRLDESNMQDVYYKPQDYEQGQLDLVADNVKQDRTSDDLLAQVMLDWGLPLSLKIEQVLISGKNVFKVAGNSLYACFDSDIDEVFIKQIAKEKPMRIVFKDSGFKDDTAKVNVKQLLKQLSPETEMKVL